MPRRLGRAITSEPTPPAHSVSSRPQPTGTASTKGRAPRRPRCAASAVDSVVLGPGVKLVAVARTSSAPHSCGDMEAKLMAHTVVVMAAQLQYSLQEHSRNCIAHFGGTAPPYGECHVAQDR